MAETPNVTECNPNADPAVAAFEGLREEVALLRRAIAAVAAERAAIEIPDYNETLGKIMRACVTAATNIRTITELPILNASLWEWAHTIEQTVEPARRADREALTKIHTQLENVAHELAATLRSARAADAQRRYLLWALAAGVLIGVLLSVALRLMLEAIL